MSFTMRQRGAVAVAAATVASLVGSAGAFAQNAAVYAGPTSSAINATAKTGPISIDMTWLAPDIGPFDMQAETGAQEGETSAQAGASVQFGEGDAHANGNAQSGRIDVQMSARLAAAQEKLSATWGQLIAAVESGRSTATARVRALRKRVRTLQRQTTKLAARIRQRAIAHAHAAADGAWLVVNGAGMVIDQSGGMEVSHVGTGTYDVSFDGDAAACLSMSGQGRVQITAPTGPLDGGFYLAAAC
jgi:hypothetical protein